MSDVGVLELSITHFRDDKFKIREGTDLGCTNKIGMGIYLKEGANPFQSKPYRINANDCANLDKIIHEYKQAGIV